MNTESQARAAPPINGHLIALGAGHSIAIYERNGKGFVAEFRDGHASLEYAGSWFRFNSGVLRRLRGRHALEFFMPLNPKMLQEIERLHAESEVHQTRVLAVPRAVAAAARCYWINVVSRLRGRRTKISERLG